MTDEVTQRMAVLRHMELELTTADRIDLNRRLDVAYACADLGHRYRREIWKLTRTRESLNERFQKVKLTSVFFMAICGGLATATVGEQFQPYLNWLVAAAMLVWVLLVGIGILEGSLFDSKSAALNLKVAEAEAAWNSVARGYPFEEYMAKKLKQYPVEEYPLVMNDRFTDYGLGLRHALIVEVRHAP